MGGGGADGTGVMLLSRSGIPVVFAEELEEKVEQAHTPLVMRIEKVPFYHEREAERLRFE